MVAPSKNKNLAKCLSCKNTVLILNMHLLAHKTAPHGLFALTGRTAPVHESKYASWTVFLESEPVLDAVRASGVG